MKVLFVVITIVFTGCEDRPKPDVQHAALQMELKVNSIIKQLREDCDSSLMQAAQAKVDSIKRASWKMTLKKRKKK